MGFTPTQLEFDQPRENVFQEVAWFAARIGPRDCLSPEQANHWHFQGIFTDERGAIGACADETYFICPVPVNVALPHDLVKAAGAYFPLRQKRIESSKNEQT